MLRKKDASGTSGVGRGIPALLIYSSTMLFVFSLAFLKVYDYDVWFHLATGEYIIKNRVIPTADVFSYTAQGSPWVTHEWLFEVILYGYYMVAGLWGLALFKALVISSVFGVYLVNFSRRGFGPNVIVPVVIISSILSKGRYIVRPELLTYLFTALFLLGLESIRKAPEGEYRRVTFLTLPLLMVIWANMHSGALFGVLFVGLYALGEAGKVVSSSLRKGVLPTGYSKTLVLSVVLALTFLAGLLNPNGLSVYTYPFTALEISERTGIGLLEYAPPSFKEDKLFFIAFSSVLLVLIMNLKRLEGAHILLFTAFSLSAFRYNRNIALWSIVTVPLIIPYVAALAEDFKTKFPRDLSRRPLLGITSSLLISALILAFSAFSVHSARERGQWGPGVMEGRFPEGAVRFIEGAGIKGNMYNSYEFGGYLIWRLYPERMVYVDGRSDVYEDLLMEQRVLSVLGFENIVEKYNINYCVFSYTESNSDYINTEPYFGTGLILVYWDDTAMVYVKNSPENRDVIEKYGYRFVRPTDLELGFTDMTSPGELISELKRNIRENPEGKRNRLILGRVLKRLGQAGPK